MNDRDFEILRADLAAFRQDLHPHIAQINAVLVRFESRVTAIEATSALRDRDVSQMTSDIASLKEYAQKTKGMWLAAGVASGAVFSVVTAVFSYFKQ